MKGSFSPSFDATVAQTVSQLLTNMEVSQDDKKYTNGDCNPIGTYLRVESPIAYSGIYFRIDTGLGLGLGSAWAQWGTEI